MHIFVTITLLIRNYDLTVYRFHRTWGVIALLEFCQDARSCSYTYHSCSELQLFQPGRISPKYASKFSIQSWQNTLEQLNAIRINYAWRNLTCKLICFHGLCYQEIAPDSAGFLHGISNSAGTLAAIVSTIGTGYFVQWLGSFQAFLTVTAGLYFAATIFWNLYATGERVF